MPKLKWFDIDEIAYQLNQDHGDLQPLEVRFTDMHRYIIELPDFDDEPGASSERTLEAIQMAWLEYYKENH
ncbi:MAG: Fe-S cluster assembly protein IscX [Phycisphaerae bacterium]|jgi:FeS assembly protein IscX